jgi:hypothetical protein
MTGPGPRQTGSAPARAMVAAVSLGLLVLACGPLSVGRDGGAATSGSASAAMTTSPLVGAWVTEITREDLRGAGIEAEGVLDENSGRFTWTFKPDGTWTQVQESLDGSSVAAPVFEGLYEVDGQELIQRTTFPEQFAGDRLVFTWGIDDDGRLALHLTNPPDEILPVVMELHPWSPATR